METLYQVKDWTNQFWISMKLSLELALFKKAVALEGDQVSMIYSGLQHIELLCRGNQSRSVVPCNEAAFKKGAGFTFQQSQIENTPLFGMDRVEM